MRSMALMFFSVARIGISGRFQFCRLREKAETDIGYVFGGTVSTGWWWAGIQNLRNSRIRKEDSRQALHQGR